MFILWLGPISYCLYFFWVRGSLLLPGIVHSSWIELKISTSDPNENFPSQSPYRPGIPVMSSSQTPPLTCTAMVFGVFLRNQWFHRKFSTKNAVLLISCHPMYFDQKPIEKSVGNEYKSLLVFTTPMRYMHTEEESAVGVELVYTAQCFSNEYALPVLQRICALAFNMNLLRYIYLYLTTLE